MTHASLGLCLSAGPLPVPERWGEDPARGALTLEETDLGSSDQVHTCLQTCTHTLTCQTLAVLFKAGHVQASAQLHDHRDPGC